MKVGGRMELIEGRDTKEEWKLPKNIRQIGEPGPGTKILIEDYVYTYLHQMAQSNLTCIKTAVLIGKLEADKAVCIQGAVETDMGQEPAKWFSHEHWRDIFHEIQSWFEGQEIVGWYMANPGFPPVLTEELKHIHRRNFSGSMQVFFQTDVLDREEVFYMGSGPSPVCGYYIYYEKNDKMQEYMSYRKGGAGIETEGIIKDRAAARFRNVMQEKREQSTQKKVLALLYSSCLFLVLVILVIGVTMVNNYDRMASMEHAIHQISESLGEEEEIEAAMEEENRLAAAEETGGEQTENAEENPAEEEEEPAASQDTEEPSEVQESSPEAQDTSPEESAEEPQEEEEPAPQEEPEPEETQPVMSQAVQEPEHYRVQKGDTLLDISRLRYGTDEMVGRICEMNGLEDGDKIYVGETILLP